MKLKVFVAVFVALCLGIGAASLVTYREAPIAPTVQPQSAWPDYSANGSVFVAPQSPDGGLIDYGFQLVTRTFGEIGPNVSEPSRRFAGNNLSCENCHFDAGTNPTGLPLVGIVRTYPKYSDRDRRVISLKERVNECMTRSMNGRALPEDSREMNAFIAFLRFIGDPTAAAAPQSAPAPQPPSAERGAEVYGRICAVCHQKDGHGERNAANVASDGYKFPPLWGPDSFNDGAGMDRFNRSVEFLRHNMPRGASAESPHLSVQEAWDVAAFLQAQPRPHYEAGR